VTTYLASLQRGIRELLKGDDRVYILGEDLLDPYGGAFKVTLGAQAAWPDRVITTPISEGGLVGVGVGMALRGLRPIVEIMFGDFMTLAADSIINYGAKLPAMFDWRVDVPLVVRTPVGGRRGYGPTHSQCLEKLFFGVPHLVIVSPSIYDDPGDALTRAVTKTRGVVLFIEHKSLYEEPLVNDGAAGLSIEKQGRYPYATAVVRNYVGGAPDVAVIAYGGTSLMVHALMSRFADDEIRVVACFPTQVQPLAIDDILPVAAEARRVVVVEEGTKSFGWGAEVAATLQDRLWGILERPVCRVAARDTIIPAARSLEDSVLPSLDDIERSVHGLL